MVSFVDPSQLLREARDASGLSQRELAACAGTSGPTIAAYESGAKEPRLSTLDRLVSATGQHLYVRVGRHLTRTDRRSLALHAAVNARLCEDSQAVLRKARKNMVTMRAAAKGRAAQRLFAEWDELLDGPLTAVSETLLSSSEHACDLRQVSPFAGVLNDGERRAVIAAAAVLL